jgi:formiminotetrahydrofolate cyclodeaminase
VLDALLRKLEADGLSSAIGPAAALVVALVTGVVEAAARESADSWPEAHAVVAQAIALRGRASRLAREDVEAHGEASAALDAATETGAAPGTGDVQLGVALTRAADVPLHIADAAADAAALAALAAERVRPEFRADAAGAALLAGGAVRAAMHLIEVNLATARDDARLAQAKALVVLSDAAVDRARAASN